MNSTEQDRRCNTRRTRGGGRRSSDREPRQQITPPCPVCRATQPAFPAGEAEGGWWFVCAQCDYMWDERTRQDSPALVAR